MPDTPSITINRQMTYRGVAEITGGTYHFSGTTPTDAAGWLALAQAIWAAEKPILATTTKFAGFLGYQAGNEHAVAIRDFVAEGATLDAGTFGTPGASTPGDVAAWVRWATPNRTSRGKIIYARKYFHEIPITEDAIPSSWQTAALTYAGKMIDGTLPGGAKYCGPQGAVLSNPKVSQWATTRTLKRRGPRPH